MRCRTPVTLAAPALFTRWGGGVRGTSLPEPLLLSSDVDLLIWRRMRMQFESRPNFDFSGINFEIKFDFLSTVNVLFHTQYDKQHKFICCYDNAHT